MNTLYDHAGHRKYLTPAERDAFLRAADESEVREVRTFCATLAYTGCRISKALALTADRIDLKDGAIVIESAKKRQRGVYRPVPVPPAFLDMLNMVTISGRPRSAATAASRSGYGHGAGQKDGT
jgi:integrase/recombinase XerD